MTDNEELRNDREFRTYRAYRVYRVLRLGYAYNKEYTIIPIVEGSLR